MPRIFYAYTSLLKFKFTPLLAANKPPKFV